MSVNISRVYLARDFIFFGVRTKYFAHIGAKIFEFIVTICLQNKVSTNQTHRIQIIWREYGLVSLFGPFQKYNLSPNRL